MRQLFPHLIQQPRYSGLAVFLCRLRDLRGKSGFMNANQALPRTAAPRCGFGGDGNLGRWIHRQRPSPAAVGDLSRRHSGRRVAGAQVMPLEDHKMTDPVVKRNVVFVLLGVAAFALKARYCGPFTEAMHVNRAEIVALTEGFGILLHAFPVDTNRAHPSFALFFWPITNPRNIPYETGEGTHTFRRIGSSEKFLVYYSDSSGFMKEEIRHAFCSFDGSFNLGREGTNLLIHWRVASDDGYPVFLQRAALPAGPWQTLTNAVEPYLEPADPAARGFCRNLRFF
jgi:hypothetical protein